MPTGVDEMKVPAPKGWAMRSEQWFRGPAASAPWVTRGELWRLWGQCALGALCMALIALQVGFGQTELVVLFAVSALVSVSAFGAIRNQWWAWITQGFLAAAVVSALLCYLLEDEHVLSLFVEPKDVTVWLRLIVAFMGVAGVAAVADRQFGRGLKRLHEVVGSRIDRLAVPDHGR